MSSRSDSEAIDVTSDIIIIYKESENSEYDDRNSYSTSTDDDSYHQAGNVDNNIIESNCQCKYALGENCIASDIPNIYTTCKCKTFVGHVLNWSSCQCMVYFASC